MEMQLEASNSTGQFEALAFKLGNEEYGVDILKVQEIRGYDAVTRIANAPDIIRGVTNLRGVIVPIVDMRLQFNTGAAGFDEFTVVIVLNIGGRTIGMVVDSVSDVIGLAPEQIKPAPETGRNLEVNYMVGLAAIDERMLILLDIEALMSSAAIGMLPERAA